MAVAIVGVVISLVFWIFHKSMLALKSLASSNTMPRFRVLPRSGCRAALEPLTWKAAMSQAPEESSATPNFTHDAGSVMLVAPSSWAP